MSFILDALKKSEHKRRVQKNQEPRTIFEPVSVSASASRYWTPLIALLLLCVVLLLGVFVWQRSRQDVVTPEQRVTNTEQRATDTQAPVIVPAPPSPEVFRPAAQQQPQIELLHQSVAEGQAETTAGPGPLPAPPAGDDPLYSMAELPAEVRRRLPALQMALHAFNANDAGAGLVQINGRLVRAGAQIADNLTVEEITASGAILRIDSYRFLLPRRGQ